VFRFENSITNCRLPFPTLSVTISTFEDIDHENDQCLDQELNIDQILNVSGAITYLVDHVMTSDKEPNMVLMTLMSACASQLEI
jgi:hypothetical protein